MGIFQKPFDARRPVITGGLVNVIRTASSLQMIIFFLSRIDIILLSACTNSESKFWATGVLWAMVAFVGRPGRHSSPRAFACIIFLVTEITLGLFGVSISLFNFTSFFTMLIVAPESAHASSLLSSLKPENWFAVATGMDGDVVVVILLVGGRRRS